MRKSKKIICFFVLSVCIAAFLSYAVISFINIPDKIVVLNDKMPNYGPLYSMNIADFGGELHGNTVKKSEKLKNGSYNGKLKMFGIIDVKNVDVKIENDKELIVCGDTIGVKLYADGILVVGISEFENDKGVMVSPAKKAGIKSGDLIKKVNGKKVEKISDFTIEVNKKDTVSITVFRDGKTFESKINAQLSKDEKTKKLGIWVRDSTAGIGTLTFYDPENGTYGALGHGITDIDTGEIMPSHGGKITRANVVSVKKGVRGIPGELQGVFINNDVGDIFQNTKYGIYGKMQKPSSFLHGKLMRAASKDEVKQGSAYILSNVDGSGVKKYEIEILKVLKQNGLSTKGMVIKVTDENLIEKCGGIVQGMSGSPIIQDEKIIGAVTHVFVNDPTRGYGIFIDTMLRH